MTNQEHRLRGARPRVTRSRAALPLLLGAAAAAACAGCGDDWQAETHPARGRVTVNGQPPAGAIVELHSAGGKPDVRNSRPWAVVGDDGSYTLTTYEKGDGAPAGSYKVVVRWPPDVSQPSLADRLGGAFSTPQRSRWTVTVAEGENELPPIEITGAKVLSKEELSRRGGPPGPMAVGGGRR